MSDFDGSMVDCRAIIKHHLSEYMLVALYNSANELVYSDPFALGGIKDKLEVLDFVSVSPEFARLSGHVKFCTSDHYSYTVKLFGVNCSVYIANSNLELQRSDEFDIEVHMAMGDIG